MLIRKQRIQLGSFAAAAAILVASQAQAFEGWGGPGIVALRGGMRDCGADIATICQGVVPGGGRIIQCLVNRRESLSPSCRARIDEALATQNAFFACNADAERLCGDVRPGGGRIVRCLLDQEPELSNACLRALDEARELSR